MFKSRFTRYVAEATEVQKTRIADLASAKHRFATIAKPFGRAVLYFSALVRTAQSILDERGASSEEGRDARSWLIRLTEESAILLAMMADCSDETLSLLQFFDSESYDKSAMTAELDAFLVRATWLFDERGAAATGYTKFMLQTLETARTITVDGKVRILGGPGQVQPPLLSKCFQVMSNWLELARRTVRADMPEFETLQFFRAFRLTGDVAPDMINDLTTLGKLFRLQVNPLLSQFHDYRPMAKRWATEGMETEDAWRKAIVDVRARDMRALNLHPCGTLSQLLARLVAWGWVYMWNRAGLQQIHHGCTPSQRLYLGGTSGRGAHPTPAMQPRRRRVHNRPTILGAAQWPAADFTKWDETSRRFSRAIAG